MIGRTVLKPRYRTARRRDDLSLGRQTTRGLRADCISSVASRDARPCVAALCESRKKPCGAIASRCGTASSEGTDRVLLQRSSAACLSLASRAGSHWPGLAVHFVPFWAYREHCDHVALWTGRSSAPAVLWPQYGLGVSFSSALWHRRVALHTVITHIAPDPVALGVHVRGALRSVRKPNNCDISHNLIVIDTRIYTPARERYTVRCLTTVGGEKAQRLNITHCIKEIGSSCLVGVFR